MAVNTDSKEKVLVEDLLSLADSKSIDFGNIVNGDYAEIVRVLGAEVALKIYIHFRGCSLSFPKHFYKPEYIVEFYGTPLDEKEPRTNQQFSELSAPKGIDTSLQDFFA